MKVSSDSPFPLTSDPPLRQLWVCRGGGAYKALVPKQKAEVFLPSWAMVCTMEANMVWRPDNYSRSVLGHIRPLAPLVTPGRGWNSQNN